MGDIEQYAIQLDDLKVVTIDAGEVWSARDLMGLAGYERWERFSDAINRAIASVNASGLDASEHFRGTAKSSPMPNGGFRQVEDVEVTRYGAYVLFQNGDARKPEIAAAQQYFAVQTRRQELAAPMTDAEIVARALQITTAQVAALEARVTELEPVAAHAETFRQADGLRTIADVANDFKTHCAEHFPGIKVLHQDVWAHAARLGIVIRGNTVRHNQPTAQAIEAGWAKPHRVVFDTNSHGKQTSVHTRLTPTGEARLWDGLCAWIGKNGSIEIKAVAA